MRKNLLASTLLSVLLLAPVAIADDWPQWLGPGGASEWHEPGVRTTLPEGDLPVKWQADCSYGYAGPAVADGRVYLFDYEIASGKVENNPGRPIKLAGRERLHCFDTETGDSIWTKSNDVDYYVSYPGGPRTTPTVDGDHVYTLGAEGDLTCRRTEDGEQVWHVNFLEKFGAKTPIWGHSSCPLVVGDLLYVMVGGEGTAVVAFDKLTGEEKWRALSAKEPGYCAPSVVQFQGQSHLIVFFPTGVAALELETGSELWNKRIQPSYGMSIAPPRVQGNQMFVSGFGESMLLDGIASASPTVLWRGTKGDSVYCSNPPPFFAEDAIFGCDVESSSLIAVDPESADRLWEVREPVIGSNSDRNVRHGTAFIVRHASSGRYFLFNELGELIVAQLTREKFTDHGRTRLLAPTNEAFGRPVVWSHPAFAERSVFARNDKEIVCVSLAE